MIYIPLRLVYQSSMVIAVSTAGCPENMLDIMVMMSNTSHQENPFKPADGFPREIYV